MRYASLALLLAACGSTTPRPPPTLSNSPSHASTSDLDPRFVDAIGAVAPAYEQWGRVDDEANYAPLDCRAPRPPSSVRMSKATDAPHGTKLYYLWASDRPAYLSAGAIEPGFAVVKESFAAVERPASEHGLDNRKTTVRVEGKTFGVGDAKGLFVMTKVDARDGTDAGWIYGTIVDGTVTSAGRVASCMGCHEASATHERLFGLEP